MDDRIKVVVIGSGPGGYVAAIRASQLGAEVVLIEKDLVGGTCLNRGCIPTKSLIASAEIYEKVKHSYKYGIYIDGDVKVNFSEIIKRKNKIVETLRKGLLQIIKSNNIRLVYGTARFLGKNLIHIKKNDNSEENIAFDYAIIATGSSPASVGSLIPDNINILTSDSILELDKQPESLVIVGGGVIGCELGYIFRTLGTRVYIVEILEHILSGEDRDVSDFVKREFKRQKIKIYTQTTVESVDNTDKLLKIALSNGINIEAEKILLSVGRKLNTDDLNLDAIGISLSDGGVVPVNDYLQTAADNIYAVGDITGKAMLAHVASMQGIIAAENIFGEKRKMDYSIIPSVIFINPEIASVGVKGSETEELLTGKFMFRASGKAQAIGEVSGFAKVYIDKKTGIIKGATIAGPHASDIISTVAIAISAELTAEDFISTIHAHPTLPEVIRDAFEDSLGRCIHKLLR